MNDTPPPSQGYFYPPGDMSIQVPSSNCTISNSPSGCQILVYEDGEAQPDIQVHHANANISTHSSRRRERRDRASRASSNTSHPRSGLSINTVNSFNNVYVGQRIVNNRTDSDEVVDEINTSYEHGEAPAPSRRNGRSRRHRSRRQRSRDVDDDPPVPVYTRRATGGDTVLEVGEDVDDSSRGSSGCGGNVLGLEAQTDGPQSYHSLDGEEPAFSSSKDEGGS